MISLSKEYKSGRKAISDSLSPHEYNKLMDKDRNQRSDSIIKQIEKHMAPLKAPW